MVKIIALFAPHDQAFSSPGSSRNGSRNRTIIMWVVEIPIPVAFATAESPLENPTQVGADHARQVVQDYPNTSIVAEYKRYRRYLKSRLIHQDFLRTPEEKRTPLMRIQERKYQKYEEYLKVSLPQLFDESNASCR